MDAISYSKAKKAHKRLDQAIESGQNLNGWVEESEQLNQKIDQKHNEVTSQLAHTTTKTVHNALTTRMDVAQTARNQELLRPLVSFIDDDGYSGVLTKLKPLFTSRNVPIGLALMNTSHVITDSAKRSEILDLQNNHGWEIMSHTMDHKDISAVTAKEYEEDCIDFIQTFNEYGFRVQSMVYPWGVQNAHRHITAKYYSSGFGTGADTNRRETMDNYAINRFGLGSSHAPNMSTLAQFKTLIDNAKVNNQWIVFMLHVDDPTNNMQLITDVLDYVISQSIEIVAPSDGVRIYGSVLQSGRRNAGKYFNIKPEGLVDTNAYSLANRIDPKTESAPPSTNRNVGINIFAVNGWTIGNGVVTEYLHESGWEYQVFRRSGSDARMYMRKWTGVEWRPWFKIGISLPNISYTCVSSTIPANSSINLTISDSTALDRHSYIASPSGALEAGIMYNCWSHGNGAIRLRLANVTSTPITIAERVWNIARFDTF